jgi:hypothetical protein
VTFRNPLALFVIFWPRQTSGHTWFNVWSEVFSAQVGTWFNRLLKNSLWSPSPGDQN